MGWFASLEEEEKKKTEEPLCTSCWLWICSCCPTSSKASSTRTYFQLVGNLSPALKQVVSLCLSYGERMCLLCYFHWPLVTNGVANASGSFISESASGLQIFFFPPFLLPGACCFKIFCMWLVFSVFRELSESLFIWFWWSCKSIASCLNALWMQSLLTGLWCLILCWDSALSHVLRDMPG